MSTLDQIRHACNALAEGRHAQAQRYDVRCLLGTLESLGLVVYRDGGWWRTALGNDAAERARECARLVGVRP